MADVVERRVVEVLGKIDQTFAKQLNQVNKELGDIKKNIQGLRDLGVGILGSVVGIDFLKTLASIADQQVSLRRSLAATIPVGQDLVKTQEDLLDISVRTQQSLEAVTGLYTRLTIAITDVNVPQKSLNTVVEAFGNTMLIAGTGVREAAGAVTQFGQALASGKLAGDEFRSIMENVPVLATVLAKNLETANGEFGVTIGELRKLSIAGELVTEKVIEAIVRGSEELKARVADLPKTIGASIQALSDGFASLIGKADQAYGITATVGNAIGGLAGILRDNAEVIKYVAGPIVVGLLVTTLGAMALVAVTLLAPLFALVSGFGALGLAVTAGAGFLAAMAIQLKAVADAFDLFGADNITLEDVLTIKDPASAIAAMDEVREKVGELQAQQDELLETRTRVSAKLAAEPAGSGNADAYTAKLAEVNKLLEANNKLLLEQADVNRLLHESYEILIKDLDETEKAKRLAEAERKKFQELTSEQRGEVTALNELNVALTVSKDRYDEVKSSQELAAKVAKDWAKAQSDGVKNTKENQAAVRALTLEENSLTSSLEKRLKVAAELDKFRDSISSAGTEYENQVALATALDTSAQAYQELTVRQKAAADVEKDLTALKALGHKVDEVVVKALVDMKVATANLNTTNEKRIDGLKNIEKFKEKVADLQAQVTNQNALNVALRTSVEAHDNLKRSQEVLATVQKEINAAFEAGKPLTDVQIAQYTALAQKMSDAAAEGARLTGVLAALATQNERSLAAETTLSNLDAQIAAGAKSKEQLEDTVRLQERAAELEKIKKEAIAGGTTDLGNFMLAQEQELDLIDKKKVALEKTNAITEGRRTSGESLTDIAAETKRLAAQAAGYRESEKAGQAVERQQTAIAKAQEEANKLHKDDLAGRKAVYDTVYAQVLQQEKLKQQVEDIADARQKEAAAAKKAEAERLAAIEKEGKLKLQLEEQTARFFQGPVSSIRLGRDSARDQLEQAQIVDDVERKIAADKYDDEKKLNDFKLQARRLNQELSEEYIESVRAEIEETSRLNRELTKTLEINVKRQAIKDAADPNKKLREEGEQIKKDLASGGVYVGEAETEAAVERLAAVEAAMTGLRRSADALAASGNPFAHLVEAAADLEKASIDAYANIDPSDKIASGGEAALSVLNSISTSMAALGIESFEAQKAIAIATATINAALAITKVLSQGGAFAIPLAVAIGALAGAQIAIIASQQPPARALGGPVSANAIYQVGERGPEMLRSLSGKNYMIPGEGGNVTPANQNRGGVIINNLGPPVSATSSSDAAGNSVITIRAAVQAVRKDFESQMMVGHGAYPRSIQRNVNASRKIS